MRRGSAIAIVCASALALGVGGYAAADIADRVPGPLTASDEAIASEPPDFGSVEAAALPQSSGPGGDPVSASQVAELWTEVSRAADEGGWTSWGSVVDAATGEVLLDASATSAHTPASTTKVLTAFTALSVLDPADTLTTSLTLSGSALHLASEGDLLLGKGASDPDAVNGRAGLADLAAEAAKALTDRGITSIELSWAGPPFEGESVLAAWAEQGVANYQGPVAAMAIDAGRTLEGAYEFVSDPAAAVAEVLAAALEERGITVTRAGASDAPGEGDTIAAIDSATIGEQIRWMLAHSDNTVAEQYCRLSAQEKRTATTFGGSIALIRQTLEEAGIDASAMTLGDCSGLSSGDRIAPATLTSAIALALDSTGALADLPRSLPWAGLSGTMTNRMTEGAALANAQAKTGSLGEVSSLAGVVETSSGRLLVFAIGNEGVPDGVASLTRPFLDDFVAGLAGL